MREKEARPAAGRAGARARGAAQNHAHPAAAAPARAALSPRRAPLTEDEIFAKATLDELNAQKLLADAFFDLDSQQIRDDAKPVLQKDADWMKRWPSTKVMVEGHADSRGTAEYNLALGERRASAVRDYLVNLGVAADRITLVSKGKEAPFCTRGERVLLVAEPPRAFRDYGEVSL